ncbi:transposase [Bradyrhizobium sp. DASA03030]
MQAALISRGLRCRISRFNSPQKLVSDFGLNPRVRLSRLGAAHHGRISKIGRSSARAMLVDAALAATKAPGPLHEFGTAGSGRGGRS